MKWIFLSLVLLPWNAQASPTRALTLDSQQMLIADDFDATIYYHLAPNFKNHLYVDVLNGGGSVGWAFLDVKYGTLVLWWNKEAGATPLFEGVAQGNTLGYQARDLAANTGNAHAPLEGWIRAPETKLSGGYAMALTDRINLGLCAQWASLNQSRDAAATDASGAPLFSAALPSQSRYFSSPGYYQNLSVTSYKNMQVSNSLGTAVSLGIQAERYALDIKGETLMNSLNNSHEEKISDAGGTMQGTVTQGLKDKGTLSWLTMGKLRVPFDDGALVLRGGYFNFDLSTQHTQTGSFSGSAFANADQLAGFDHVDADEAYSVKKWDAMIGWTQGFDKNRSMVVLGIGMNSQLVRQDDTLYAPKSGGPTVKYNDLSKLSRSETVTESMALPLVMGAEMEIAKFAKCSGSVMRDVIGSSMTKVTTETFDSSNGNLTARTTTQSGSDLNSGWQFNTGLGLYFGSFSWDFAVNSAFFASSGGWVNPAYQSTLSWGY
jgi:hypothetical protein